MSLICWTINEGLSCLKQCDLFKEKLSWASTGNLVYSPVDRHSGKFIQARRNNGKANLTDWNPFFKQCKQQKQPKIVAFITWPKEKSAFKLNEPNVVLAEKGLLVCLICIHLNWDRRWKCCWFAMLFFQAITRQIKFNWFSKKKRKKCKRSLSGTNC